MTELDGAEGAFLDPVTGDSLFSTFGGGNRVIVVRGFAAADHPLRGHAGRQRRRRYPRGPGDFNVHVRLEGRDVDGSPQPGSGTGTRLHAAPPMSTTRWSPKPVPGVHVPPSRKAAPPTGASRSSRVSSGLCTDHGKRRRGHAQRGHAGLREAPGWSRTSPSTSRSGGLSMPDRPCSRGARRVPTFSLAPGSYVVSDGRTPRATQPRSPAIAPADGSITLAADDVKTCTIINRAVSVGPAW